MFRRQSLGAVPLSLPRIMSLLDSGHLTHCLPFHFRKKKHIGLNECDEWVTGCWRIKRGCKWMSNHLSGDHSSWRWIQFVPMNMICSDEYSLFRWRQFVPLNAVPMNVVQRWMFFLWLSFEDRRDECSSTKWMRGWMSEWIRPPSSPPPPRPLQPLPSPEPFDSWWNAEVGDVKTGSGGQESESCFSADFPLLFRCFSAAF